jgi:hypothetical protein
MQSGKMKSLSRDRSRKALLSVRFFLSVPTDGDHACCQVWMLEGIDQPKHDQAYRDRHQDYTGNP